MRIVNNELKQIINVDLNDALYFGIKESFKKGKYAIILRPDKKEYYIIAQGLSIEAANILYDGIFKAFKNNEEEYTIKLPNIFEEEIGRYMTQDEMDTIFPILKDCVLEFGYGKEMEYQVNNCKKIIEASYAWIKNYKEKIDQLPNKNETIAKLQNRNLAYKQNCNYVVSKTQLQNYYDHTKPSSRQIKIEYLPSTLIEYGMVDFEVKSTTTRAILSRIEDFIKKGIIYMVEKNNKKIKALNNIESEEQLLKRIKHEEEIISNTQRKLELFYKYKALMDKLKKEV